MAHVTVGWQSIAAAQQGNDDELKKDQVSQRRVSNAALYVDLA